MIHIREKTTLIIGIIYWYITFQHQRIHITRLISIVSQPIKVVLLLLLFLGHSEVNRIYFFRLVWSNCKQVSKNNFGTKAYFSVNPFKHKNILLYCWFLCKTWKIARQINIHVYKHFLDEIQDNPNTNNNHNNKNNNTNKLGQSWMLIWLM